MDGIAPHAGLQQQLGQSLFTSVLHPQVLRKAFRFITVAMAVTCLFVWIDPEAIADLFGADNPEYVAVTDEALRSLTKTALTVSSLQEFVALLDGQKG